MKWPKNLVLIRHAESEYNRRKKDKEAMDEYRQFKALFDEEFARVINRIDWPSPRLKALAEIIRDKIQLTFSDSETPLSDEGLRQAEIVGKRLPEIIKLPDVIYVSPYLRTHQTLDQLTRSWPDLQNVTTKEDERIREQGHGLSTLFNDWRLYFVFNPQQGLLYKLEGQYWYRYQNGDSVADVRERTRSIRTTITREHAGQNVMCVTHHLTILSFLADQFRWTVQDFLDWDHNKKPINAGVTILRGDPHQGADGRLVLDTKEYSIKLY